MRYFSLRMRSQRSLGMSGIRWAMKVLMPNTRCWGQRERHTITYRHGALYCTWKYYFLFVFDSPQRRWWRPVWRRVHARTVEWTHRAVSSMGELCSLDTCTDEETRALIPSYTHRHVPIFHAYEPNSYLYLQYRVSYWLPFFGSPMSNTDRLLFIYPLRHLYTNTHTVVCNNLTSYLNT